MLQSLTLNNFRCFKSINIKFASSIEIIHGKNAHGKTSILEAICVLMRLSSPRTNILRELVNLDNDYFIVSGNYNQNEISNIKHQDSKIGVKYSKKAIRELSVNGVRQSKILDYLDNSGLICWLGNNDKNLILGGGTFRRKYLDFTCSQTDKFYLIYLRKFNHLLKIRNKLLKNSSLNLQQLNIYDKEMVKYADLICQIREEVLTSLKPFFSEASKIISNKNDVVSFKYKKSMGDDYLKDLESNLRRDVELKSTSIGPHRDDFIININNHIASKFASEGQSKTLAISLKLSQNSLINKLNDQKPIMLIDDIFGELDEFRREALLEFLPKESQIFITTTNLNDITKSINNAQCLKIENGNILY